MPLAIELTAARSGSLGADGGYAALEDRLRLLSGGRRPHGRHRSLQVVIGWSYDLRRGRCDPFRGSAARRRETTIRRGMRKTLENIKTAAKDCDRGRG